MQTRGRVEIIELLRGLAAFAVVWYHFTESPFIQNRILELSGAQGWLGVQVFFVISGFVIPYSMWRAGYRAASHSATFIAKRVVRLDPPYLVTIALGIGLWHLSQGVPALASSVPDVSIAQLVLHLGYLNAFFDYSWVNPVFWTLAIEFQYYFLMALLFPFVASDCSWIRVTTLGGLCLLAVLIPSSNLIFLWLPLFTMGMLTFHYHAGWITARAYLYSLFALFLVGGWTLGSIMSVTGVATALLIGHVRLKAEGPFSFLGKISYSLYLVHVPVGGGVLHLASRPNAGIGYELLLLSVAITASIGAAYAMYRWVERPSQRWSSVLCYQVTPVRDCWSRLRGTVPRFPFFLRFGFSRE